MGNPRLIIKASVSGAATEPSRGFATGIGPGAMTRYAPTNKLRTMLADGRGEYQAQQLMVTRMMRTQPEDGRVPPHVVVVEDITRGLGLDQVDAERIQKAIASTNVTFTPKTQTQRLFLGQGALVTLLRSMKHVDSDARLEIARRARTWWKKNTTTDLNRPSNGKFTITARKAMEPGDLVKGKDGKPVRWITVRGGARIPVGADGKLMGDLGRKIMAHGKKEPVSAGDYPHEVTAAVTSIARMPGTGGGVSTAKRVGVLMAAGAVQARKALKAAEGHGLVNYHRETKSWSLTDRGKKLAAGKRKPLEPDVKKSMTYARPNGRRMSLEWR